MQVNWKRYILLMLPIRLRNSKALFALIWALTQYTRRKYDEEYNGILQLIEELKYTSCVKAMKELLEKRFGEGIEITDGTDYNISFFKEDEQVGEDVERVTLAYGDNEEEKTMIIPDKESTVGVDFVVAVPQHIDKDRVAAFIERYVFEGVDFKTITKE